MNPMKSGLGVAIAVALLAASGCRDDADGWAFELSGRLFVFNYRVATATYLVTLRPNGSVEAGQTAVASFEDPAGGPAIVVEQRIWPNADKVSIESPPLRCVAEGRPYRVTIAIRDDAGAVRQTLETTITSTVDQSVLPDRPLVLGPVYTPNPDLAGRPGGDLPGDDRPPCPPADRI